MRKLCVGTFFVVVDVDPDEPETTGGSEDYASLDEAWPAYLDAIPGSTNAKITVTLYEAARPGDHTEVTLHECGDWTHKH